MTNINIGAGSLQIKNGIWFAVFYNNDTKKYIWRTTKVRVPNVHQRTKTYKDAEREADSRMLAIREALIQDMKATVEVEPDSEPKITVICLIQDWLNTNAKREIRKSTYSTYLMYCKKRIFPFFESQYPDLPAEDISHKIMREFAKTMKAEGLRNDSIRKYLVPIRNAYAFGFDEDIIDKNPIQDYRYSPERKTLEEKEAESQLSKRAYSKQEVKAMMASIEKEIDAPAVIPIILALRCGLRREETCGLRFSDIDFERKIMTIRNTVTSVIEVIEEENTKSVSGMRTVPIDDWTLKFLLHVRDVKTQNKETLGAEYQSNDYVYTRWDGRTYYPDTATSQLKKFLRRNHLNKITLHELRHTFCTILISAGKDLKTVQKIMGHKDSRMTIEVYTHAVEDKIFSAADAMEFFLGQ